MNCVSWQEAFAFCIWDGGRLPTEEEWEYAGVGGAEYRFPYAWGSDPPEGRAVWWNGGLADPAHIPQFLDILSVGSPPLGAARWGQLDMTGSMMEFVLDLYAPFPAVCHDCANTTQGSVHVMRGGNRYDDTSDNGGFLRIVRRDYWAPEIRWDAPRFRCARDR